MYYYTPCPCHKLCCWAFAAYPAVWMARSNSAMRSKSTVDDTKHKLGEFHCGSAAWVSMPDEHDKITKACAGGPKYSLQLEECNFEGARNSQVKLELHISALSAEHQPLLTVDMLAEHAMMVDICTVLQPPLHTPLLEKGLYIADCTAELRAWTDPLGMCRMHCSTQCSNPKKLNNKRVITRGRVGPDYPGFVQPTSRGVLARSETWVTPLVLLACHIRTNCAVCRTLLLMSCRPNRQTRPDPGLV